MRFESSHRLMDIKNRQLERQAALGDPDAKLRLEAQQNRLSGVRTFVLNPQASERTKQRWIAHSKGQCSPKCRFCRRNILCGQHAAIV